jgi:glycosyltransferase involved in cell wall biosynthesis/MoaA/NifB/PqqE/SkfB family radical SAM enzyme
MQVMFPTDKDAGGQKRSNAGVTIFAMPKPFADDIGIIQKNAIRSWTRLRPKPEIILFGDEPGIREMAEEVGARHVPDVKRNEFGTPLVDQLFRVAQDIASHSVMAYVNADMILFQDFVEGVDEVRAQLSEFLLIGQRWDLPLFDEIDFSQPDWQQTLQKQVAADAMIHPESGLDYFVFRKGLWPAIPPFALGRTVWDNWLVLDPNRRGIPVADGTEYITAVHQDHDYGHMAGGRQEAWHGTEAKRNRTLAGETDNAGRTSGATYALRRDGALAKVQPRESLCSTAAYKDQRTVWLLKQAENLLAVDKNGLAACKCEEALTVLQRLVLAKHRGSRQVEFLDSAALAQRYATCHTLLARCYLKMGRYDQVAAVYTRLLESSCVQIPPAARAGLARLRDQATRLSQECQSAPGPHGTGPGHDAQAETIVCASFKSAGESVRKSGLCRSDAERLIRGPEVTRGVNPLDEIAIRHGTDKSSAGHDYMRSYYRYFAPLRKQPLKILEIGINRGCSLRTWHEFFERAEIFAVDIDPSCRALEGGRIHVFIGDQTDPVFLRSVVDAAGGSFDIVIDDGGHLVVQQITSFDVLLPYVTPGGIYVIEDLHTSYWPNFGGGQDKPDTTVGLLKGLVDIINRHGRKGRGSSPEAWLAADQAEEECPAKEIESIEFCRSICFMVKKGAGPSTDFAGEGFGKATVLQDRHVTAPAVAAPGVPAGPPCALPKVSVVLACHDAQQYLSECLDSVLAQTLPDWELHVLDDGSTDDTRRIIEEYAGRDARIVPYYFDDNTGPYVRRNLAIERSRAPFIVIQDADDIMCPDKLQRLYHAITQDDRLGVVGSFYRMFLDEYQGVDHTEDVALQTEHEQILQDYRDRAVCDYAWHGSAIIRKRLFEELGPYDENPFSSDSFWLAKVAEYACRSDGIRLKNIPEFLTLRRMRTDSQTGNLPSFDPRGRRAMFRDYRRNTLSEVTQKLNADPDADVKAELRKSVCSDFVARYGHLFESSERQPLTNSAVNQFITRIHAQFGRGQWVRCINTCGIVERLAEGIVQTVRCYDLVRGLAYFILGLPERSREYLEREVRTHGTEIAREFCRRRLDRYDGRWSRQERAAIVRDMIDHARPVTRPAEIVSSCVTSIADRRPGRGTELSIIVRDVDDATLWARRIAAFGAQSDKNFEVVVLGRSGRTDQYAALMEAGHFDFAILQAPESIGPWQYKNIAVDRARGRYVAFLGDWVLPEPDFVHNVIRRVHGDDLNGLRGRIVSDSASPVCFDLGPEALYAACDTDEMCVFRKDVLVSLGGYPEIPFTRGAIRLSYQIYTDPKVPARPIFYCPEVVARYVGPTLGCERLVDRFALEDYFSLDDIRPTDHSQDDKECDILAFLRFVRHMYCLYERTSEDGCKCSLDDSLFFGKRFPAVAVEWAQAVLAHQPDSLKARYVVGSLFAHLNQPERACTFLEQVLAPLEKLLAVGRIDRAHSDFRDYANLRDCYTASCTLLAQCYARMGRYREVAVGYTRLLENRNVRLAEAERDSMKYLRDRLLHSVPETALSVRPSVVPEVVHTEGETASGWRPDSKATLENQRPDELRPERPEVANAAEPVEVRKDCLAELEAAYGAMAFNAPGKHATAVRLAELCRRVGQMERGNAYAMQALKIKNGLAFNDAKRRRPNLCSHKPVIVEFNVITRCNAGCIMCNYGPQGEIMELDRFKRAADELLPGARKAMLIGGEVLLHPDFYEMCEYTSHFGVSLGMTTNLCLLTNRRAEAIQRFFHVVRVSADGATPHMYESIRTHLSFDRLQDNLRTLAEIRRQRTDMKLELAFAAMRQNIAELPDAIEMAARFGFDSVAVSFVRVNGRLTIEDSLLFHRERANHYFELARRRAEALGLRFDIPNDFDLSRQPFIAPEAPTVGHKQCVRPWERVRVFTNGDIIPCCHLHSLPMGNAFAGPFEPIWNGPKYVELREALTNSREGMPRECKHCRILQEGTDPNDAMLHVGPDHLPAVKQRLEEASSKASTGVVISGPQNGFRPKVTVVTACRNGERFLAESIESVRRQTLGEWELLLLDDASTDGTRHIIEEYARRDPRIRPFYFDTSTGPYVRRNFALERAESDFIVIHDSDDLMLPTKLEGLYGEISRDERLAMVGSFYRTFFEDFKGIAYTDPIELPLEHEQIVEQAAKWRHGISHISAIIRKSMFEAIGGYDENPFAADAFWSAKLAEYSRHRPDGRFRNVPEYLTLYRVHDDSQTQVLSTFDPRNRRVRYRGYCESKLERVREKMRSVPGADIAWELRRCTCSDFLARFKAQIITWESEPLDRRVVPNLLQSAVGAFNAGCYVSCVSILTGVETMEPAISERIVGLDLLKGMALFALEARDRSLACLEREIDHHGSRGAREFVAEAFEREDGFDVSAWCRENAERYDLGLSSVEAAASLYAGTSQK